MLHTVIVVNVGGHRMMQGQVDAVIVGTDRGTASRAANPAFDVTPARLVSGYLTERGLLDAV
ncbi:hypothetical protein QH494_24580 [Sphingomonas sp. AR_OL41]|uniref:hypothetical protein n=1 Tax=Sphingomonas sp. AR_OL41 TaxID=3042729 RepID=UPI00248012A8|nr:hypothetical protein [Sphingomonas sp. AR_OL41]MDH7975376.1 hypothetical protein [Sphingomonas sp. AR_OL41]